MTSHLVLACALLAGGLALAACGDDDNGGDGGGETVGAEGGGFEAEANAICHALAVEQKEINAEIGAIQSDTAAIEQIERFQAAERGQLGELRSLKAPAAATEGYRPYLALQARLVKLADRAVAAIERNPGEEGPFLAVADQRVRLVDRARAIAAGIGLEVCAHELDADAEDEPRELIERAAKGEVSGEECLEIHTEAFAIGSSFVNDAEACLEDLPMADSVEITAISGIDGVSAEAKVTVRGVPGREPGERDGFAVQLVHDDGWKIDATDPQPQE